MLNHTIFSFYTIFFLFSTIGYGYLFSRIAFKDLLKLNIGYQGLIGFFFLSILSIASSLFFVHNFQHNIIVHTVGIISFLFFFKDLNKSKELKFMIFLLLIFWIGNYIYKSHDDFPYYHLTYTLNLSENSFLVGTGNFSHGFRTFSSLFFYHSLLYMPTNFVCKILYKILVN